MILTAEAVSAALAVPPEQRDGQVICQVCSRSFATRNALGPHQLNHRRAVGLAAPKASHVMGLPSTLACSLPGCTSVVTRPGYRTHLRKVHRLAPAAVDRVVADHAVDLPARRAGAAVVRAVEEEAAPPGPDPLMTDLAAVDAVAGILNAARRDGLIPVVMLRQILGWVGHTEEVLSELARLTDGAR